MYFGGLKGFTAVVKINRTTIIYIYNKRIKKKIILMHSQLNQFKCEGQVASQTLYKQKPYQGRVYICSCRHDCSVRTG